MVFLLSIALLVVSANALIFNGPVPTDKFEDGSSLDQGWTPRPTLNPQLFGVLRKRVGESGSLVGYSLESNTCGYISGSLGTPAPLPQQENES